MGGLLSEELVLACAFVLTCAMWFHGVGLSMRTNCSGINGFGFSRSVVFHGYSGIYGCMRRGCGHTMVLVVVAAKAASSTLGMISAIVRLSPCFDILIDIAKC